MDWTAKANCRGVDPELFHPERGTDPADVAAAKAVCAGCEVREPCLEEALARNERLGVWGGLTTTERRAVVRTRRLAMA